MGELHSQIIISVVSNIILEPYFIPLLKSCFNGTKLYINPIPYGEHESDVYRKQLTQAELIILWLNFEDLFPNYFFVTKGPSPNDIIVMYKDLLAYLTSVSDGKIFCILFEDYYAHSAIVLGHSYDVLIDKINLELVGQSSDRVTYIDLKKLIAEVGITHAYDPLKKYRWNAPYSKALIEVVSKEIYKQYLIENGVTKKCLVLDCDNVLWGGILSEEGIENLKLGSSGLGRSYQDFQRFVLWLYYHGVILAICSKNDLSDVMTMFRNHSGMILREEHIACFQVNWANKPDNIKQIADTLNIELDSMVFVDDSSIEIEAVKFMLPEVTSIFYEHDVVYDQLSCFNLKSNIRLVDIEKRSETYRTNQARKALKIEYESYDDYINALEIGIDIHEATPIEFSRISELTQRTNKCTNGKRYTIVKLKERVASKNIKLYSISVSDRFSDLGIVGALEIEGETLTLFSLSCRALGRDIEKRLIDFIVDKYQIRSIKFKTTGKNEDIKRLLLKSFPNATITN